MAHTKERIKGNREKIRRNPLLSSNKMAAKENVNRKTMQVKLNEDLGSRLYCKRKVQGLTKSLRIKRLQRCKKLIRRHGKKSIDRIIFSD